MREILFRGKEKRKNGKWIEGHYEMFSKTHRIIVNDNCVYCPHLYPVIPETVGQFIGLTDKNGVKVFEGDIVKVYDDEDIYVVEYNDDDAAFEVTGQFHCICNNFSSDLFGTDVEVIGNIYDNPELLEG